MKINLELPFVRDMFDSIAPRYDFLNRLLSMRQDVSWRKALVKALKVSESGFVLDVACGTCDVPIEIRRQKGPGVSLWGVDFSPGMLKMVKDKLCRSGVGNTVRIAAANAFYLPFRKATFHAVTIAFGIRNITDKKTILCRFYDILKPGGQLLVLELSTPESTTLQRLYLLYFSKMLPFVGGFFSKNKMAYQYLPVSVVQFPPPPRFAAIMSAAGFVDVRWKNLSFGIASLYSGMKPKGKSLS